MLVSETVVVNRNDLLPRYPLSDANIPLPLSQEEVLPDIGWRLQVGLSAKVFAWI